MKELKKTLKYLILSGNVPFLKGEPGVGKSTISREIASELGFEYVDLRLSAIEPTDLGFPRVMKEGLEFVLPEWAYKAMNEPVLIHLEELNRAPRAVRNSILGLILEKTLHNRHLKYAYFIASGNTSENGVADVYELDDALKSRLIFIRVEPNLKDWIEYAKNNKIHHTIIGFLQSRPEFFFAKKNENNEEDAFPNPRSWEKLSNFLKIIEKDEDIKEYSSYAEYFVGTRAGLAFMRYVSSIALSLKEYLESSNIELNETLANVLANDITTNEATIDIILSKNHKKVLESNFKKIKNILDLIADDLKFAVINALLDRLDGRPLEIMRDVLDVYIEQFRVSLFKNLNQNLNGSRK